MATTKLELLQSGAFPNQFDPWLEKSQYFHQFHAQMIGNLLNRVQMPAYQLGYVVGREVGIQISHSQPDLFFSKQTNQPTKSRNYEALVLDLSIEAGIKFLTEREIELDRLFIKAVGTGRVVTVIEIISPSNKTDIEKILLYQSRRQELLDSAVDVIEIDLTRSFKHLIDEQIVQKYPYHIAIHLNDSFSRFLGIKLDERLKAFALPLEDKVIPIELHQLYSESYAQLLIAAQMQNYGHYSAENLPFPSTLTDTERQQLLTLLQDWQATLELAT